MGGYTFLPTKLALSCSVWFTEPFWYMLWLWSGLSEATLIVTLNTGMVRLPRSSVAIVSTYYISSTVFTSLMGLATFDLFSSFDAASLATFIAGTVLCFLGVFVVAYRGSGWSDEWGDAAAGAPLLAAAPCSEHEAGQRMGGGRGGGGGGEGGEGGGVEGGNVHDDARCVDDSSGHGKG